MNWCFLLILSPILVFSDTISPNWIDEVPQLFPRLPIAAPFSDNAQCREDSVRLVKALQNGTEWAVSNWQLETAALKREITLLSNHYLRVFNQDALLPGVLCPFNFPSIIMYVWDASSKAPNGIVEASNLQLGDFDSCMMVKGPITPKYCITHYTMIISPNISSNESVYPRLRDRGLSHNKMFTPMDYAFWGICVPVSCSATDMTISANNYITTLPSNPVYRNIVGDIANYSAFVLEHSCTAADEELEMKSGEKAFWIFVLVSVCLAILCTLLQTCHTNPSSFQGKLIECFSLITNFETITTFKEREEAYPFTGFNFIKVGSMFGVYFAHRTMAASWTANEHFFGESNIERPGYKIPIQMDYGPDLFLFITGCLTCFLVLQELQKGFINPISLLLIRLVRMLPLYFFAVWFHTVGINRLGDGPLWKLYAGNEVKICEKTWWVNLLLINNYYRAEEICMTTSWYVSADVHCFVAAVIILMIMKWQEKVAVAILLLLSTLLTLPAIFKTYNDKIGIFFMFKNTFMMRPRDEPMFTDLYIKTHYRASVYFVGMLYGYFLFKTRHWKSELSLWRTVTLLAISLTLSFAPSFILSDNVFEPVTDENKLKIAIWGTIRRPMFCIGFSLFMHVYRFRKLEFLKTITESKFFTFLSRMTYGFYLFHFATILISASWIRYPTTGDWAAGVMNGISDCTCTLLLAVVMTLLVDAPIQNFLHKVVFAKAVKRWKNKDMELEENGGVGNSYRL